MAIWFDKEAEGWKNKFNPLTNRYERTYDNGMRITPDAAVKGAITIFGLWIVIGWAYIFIVDYTWTTLAVVTGVGMGALLLFSLFTVGILRTIGITLRFALWAFLLVVMSAPFLWVLNVGFEKLTSGERFVALLAMMAAWLYGAVKLFRLAFWKRGLR